MYFVFVIGMIKISYKMFFLLLCDVFFSSIFKIFMCIDNVCVLDFYYWNVR